MPHLLLEQEKVPREHISAGLKSWPGICILGFSSCLGCHVLYARVGRNLDGTDGETLTSSSGRYGMYSEYFVSDICGLAPY